MRRRAWRWRRDDGAAALELALVMPVFLLLVAVMVGAGRLSSTKASLVAVAREAGRAAVEARDAPSAAEAAHQAAQERAVGYGLDPDRLRLESDQVLERGGTYTVRAHYDLALADLPMLGLFPSLVTLDARHAEPGDVYRDRLAR